MFAISKQFTITLFIALTAGTVAQAQSLTAPARGGQIAQPAVEDVQIIIQSQQLRISSRSTVVELQLQVFDRNGVIVYDSGLVSGSELSWAFRNTSDEAIPSGLYAYTLTVKDANAETSALRRGHMIVERGRDRDPQTDRLWVTSQGPVGAEASVSAGEMTVSTGPEANVVGARIGRAAAASSTLNLDFFGTPGRIPMFTGGDSLSDSVISQDFNGKIGIGTQRPGAALLTVAGQIETTSGGIKFPNGTVQLTSAAGALFQVNHDTTLTGNGAGDTPLGVAIPLILNAQTTSSSLLGVFGSASPFPLLDVGAGLGAAIRGSGGLDGFPGVIGDGAKDNSLGLAGEGVQAFGGESNMSVFHSGGTGVDAHGGNGGSNGGNGGFGVDARGGDSFHGGGAGVRAVGGASKNREGGIGIWAFAGGGVSPSLAGRFEGGNIAVMLSGGGVILRSPNATCYLLTVSDGGSITSTKTGCP